MRSPTQTLTYSCHDQKSLVARVSGILAELGANLIHLDQYVEPEQGFFFMRIEWEKSTYDFHDGQLAQKMQELPRPLELNFSDSEQPDRVALFCSKQSHCLYDQLIRFKEKQMPGEVAIVISNHPDLQPVAEFFGVRFEHVDIKTIGKEAAEAQMQKLCLEEHIDLIVLARYMQIISAQFVNSFRNKIINIHHSFLPAFVGAKPYHQAYERGVKIIGATSHYVTAELDAGPIIAQDTAQVSHRLPVDDYVVLGQDMEKTVLAQAVKAHLQKRVFIFGNKTVVFE